MYRIIFLFTVLFHLNIALAQELKDISAEEFIAENPSPERIAIIDFLTHQFDNKKGQKITQAQLDYIWSNEENRNKFMMYRFQIIDQKLYADSYDRTVADFRAFSKYFQNLVQNYKIQDIDFILYRIDRIPTNLKNDSEKETAMFPAIIMSKNLNSPYEKDKILIPDNFIANRGWKGLTKNIIEANIDSPWEDKIEKIFWRGSTSNGTYSINNFNKLPRLTLSMLSKLYPDLIDAKFSKITQQFPKNSDGKKMKQTLRAIWNESPQEVKEVDHLKYKYLISIDGNTCAWSRVPWIMLSNSALLKQETDNMEWFYPAMVPYIHYVPINTELTNIFSQLEWIKTHDEELKQISKNATDFAANNLMPEHVEAHMALVLNKYHDFHGNEKLVPSIPTFDDMMSLWMLIRVLKRLVKDKFLLWKDTLEYDLMGL